MFADRARCFLAVALLLVCPSGGCGSDSNACVDPALSDDLPNLTGPPRFLATTTASIEAGGSQAILDRPEPVEALIPVNAETRGVSIGIREPESGEQLWSKSVATPGNETIRIVFSPEMYYYLAGYPGEYHMWLALGGASDDPHRVRFDANPDVSVPYERTVVESFWPELKILQVDTTCNDFGLTPGVGSGTLLVREPGACEDCVPITCEAIGCDDGDPCTLNDCDLVREECFNTPIPEEACVLVGG